MKKNYLLGVLVILLSVSLCGCGKPQQKMSPLVSVKPVIEQDVTDSIESTGRITAKYTTNLVARVSGYLQKFYFKEGDKVKKGEVLFLIEPDQYQIALSQATASLRQAEANYLNAEKDLVRADELVKNDYVSKSEYDRALAQRDALKASVDTYTANVEAAKLNLSYTKVVAPTDGKIGKRFITEGNFVTANSGTIATVVSVSPIYVEYNIKSSDYMSLLKHTKTKKISEIKAEIKLSDGSTYQEKGNLEFVNNEVDPTSGTIKVRATFQNKDNLLIPGDYVTVVSTIGKPYKVKTIPEEAVLSDSKGKYVYVLGEGNTAVQKPVKVTRIYNGNWILDEGLELGEKVIYMGLTQLKPNLPVTVKDETKIAQPQQPKDGVKGGK